MCVCLCVWVGGWGDVQGTLCAVGVGISIDGHVSMPVGVVFYTPAPCRRRDPISLLEFRSLGKSVPFPSLRPISDRSLEDNTSSSEAGFTSSL